MDCAPAILLFEFAGLPQQSEEGWQNCWQAIKSVWASQWNTRALLALRKAGLDHSALKMAVLCQQVVDASYAFVAHTRHPTTGILELRQLVQAKKPDIGSFLSLRAQAKLSYVINLAASMTVPSAIFDLGEMLYKVSTTGTGLQAS